MHKYGRAYKTVNGQQMVVAISLGVISSLIAGSILWFFREQVHEVLAALDMSTGAAFAWIMAFIMLAVIIAFPLMDKDIPSPVTSSFAVLVGWLLASTVWRRR